MEFGLRFESAEDEGETPTTLPESEAPFESEPPAPASEKKDADVVSLDSFRK